MRKISRQRSLVESEGSEHAVVRGRIGRFHLENMVRLQKILGFCLTAFGLKAIGQRHALDIAVEHAEFAFKELPAAFNGLKIAFLSDLHIDCLDGLAEKTVEVLETLDYDYCILGGDYSFDHEGECELAWQRMRWIAERITKRSRVFAVLGNHDKYRMGEVLEQCGVEVLVNEHVRLERKNQAIYLVGVDDCHYFGADDAEIAEEGIADNAFKVMICHSPEFYADAANMGYLLYLAGHTHGGQVCLPGGVMLVRGATAPRRVLKGRWQQKQMAGYTTRGIGTSGVAVRHFCRPEITLITLAKS